MVKIMSCEDNYFDIANTTGFMTVLYGAGIYGRRAFPYLKNIAYVCDERAGSLRELNGKTVISPQELEAYEEMLLIVICVKAEEVREQIKEMLCSRLKNAMIFDYFNNTAFDIYQEKTLESGKEQRSVRHIHLIYDGSGWIIGKFADHMKAELEKMKYKCTISGAVDPTADINHHVIYDSCSPVIPYRETFMITHIDSVNKIRMLKHNLKKAMMGICMSRETMEKLAGCGLPREKLCYINPAQDDVIKPRKYVLGITHKTHDDHRKKETILTDLCSVLNPDYFMFKIMGSGWETIVKEVQEMRFQVEYYPEFDYTEYVKLMPSLDYYLYWGFDEGSMGYLDALRAGVKTIVTPQGFHLDVKNGITYPCSTVLEFQETLLKIQEEREKRVHSVDTWTWDKFVRKHLEVWNYLLGNDEDIYNNQHMYQDGIFSVLRMHA